MTGMPVQFAEMNELSLLEENPVRALTNPSLITAPDIFVE